MVSPIEKRIERKGLSLMSFDSAKVIAPFSTLCGCFDSRSFSPWDRTEGVTCVIRNPGRTANERVL
jgi:hypothetical protein